MVFLLQKLLFPNETYKENVKTRDFTKNQNNVIIDYYYIVIMNTMD